MRATERYVNFYDLVVKVRAKHAPVPPIMPLIELWKIPPNNRLARLKKAWSGRAKEFDKARIAFKDRNDRSHTVELSLDHGTPEQQLYVRSARFDAINPPLDQSSETIQAQLSGRIVHLLLQERDGG